MTKLYIDNDLKLRAHPNGWPVEPSKLDFFDTCDIHGASRRVYVGGDFGYEKASEKYTIALAKAKKESVEVEMGKYAGDIFDKDLKPGTFIDLPVEVEFYDKKVLYNGYGNNGNRIGFVARYRTERACRLKPQNSAIAEVFSKIPHGKYDQHYKGDNSGHSFTEGHVGDITNPFVVPSDPGVKAYYDAAHVDPEREAFEQGLDRTLNLQEQNEHLRTERAKYKELWHLDRKRSNDLQAHLDAANKRVAELEGAMADMITAPVYPAGLKDRILESFDKGNMRNPYDELERVLEENGII